eukprot:scaffold1954_cov63-Phaeocystis_antarctica.AAC.7
MQQVEDADEEERTRMPTTERRACHFQRLAVQQLRGGEVALDRQQRAEVVDGVACAWMPIAEGLALHQQQAEAVDGIERVRMPIAQGLAQHLQRLSAQRLGGEVALGQQQ